MIELNLQTVAGEGVATQQLKDGDVVLNHGILFRLKDKLITGSDGDYVCRFKTDALARLNDIIPHHWIADWIIQGNNHARWWRVTDKALLQSIDKSSDITA